VNLYPITDEIKRSRIDAAFLTDDRIRDYAYMFDQQSISLQQLSLQHKSGNRFKWSFGETAVGERQHFLDDRNVHCRVL